MSTSAAVEIIAGSKSATAWAMGKLSVWSSASGSGDGPGLPVGLQAIVARTNASGPARMRIRGRLHPVTRAGVGDERRDEQAADHRSIHLGVQPPFGEPDVDEGHRAAEPQQTEVDEQARVAVLPGRHRRGAAVLDELAGATPVELRGQRLHGLGGDRRALLLLALEALDLGGIDPRRAWWGGAGMSADGLGVSAWITRSRGVFVSIAARMSWGLFQARGRNRISVPSRAIR